MEEDKLIVFTDEDFTVSGENQGHGYVDLGLPSGLKWATCNIGAKSPEESGDYFAWGETAPKERYCEYNYDFYAEFDEDDYEWDAEEEGTLYHSTEYEDDDAVLEPADDAATRNWGEGWRMPTYEECEELLQHCEITWGEYKGVKGKKVKGPNGNGMFIPASGFYDEDGLLAVGEVGGFWSSTSWFANDRCGYWGYYHAWVLYLTEKDTVLDYFDRSAGYLVRPVLK